MRPPTLRTTSLVCLTVMWGGLAACAPPRSPDAGDLAGGRTVEIHRLVERWHDTDLFDGVVLVSWRGDVLYRGAFGTADETWPVEHRTDTRFRIGSITKSFTAGLLLDLAERGMVDLDAPLDEYLDAYRSDQAERVTVRQLLMHTSGVPDPEDPERRSEFLTRSQPTEQIVTRYCAGDLQFDPGAGWRYSNCGYLLAGAVIEEVTGRPFGDAIRAFLDSAGLDATGLTRGESVVPRLAEGYALESGAVRPAPAFPWSNFSSSGALHSTAGDLYRWHRLLLGDSLLSRPSVERMERPGPSGYALGWWVRRGPLERVEDLLSEVRLEAPLPEGRTTDTVRLHVATHGGGLPGFHAKLVRILNEPAAVVLLDNHQIDGAYGHRRITRLASDIVRVLYGRTPEPCRDRCWRPR